MPLRDEAGQLTGYIGTVTDVTAQKAEERAQQVQQQLLARVTDAVPGVVYQYELAADGTQRFLFVSQGAVPMFGLPPERILADFSLFWNTVVPEDAAGIVASLQQSARMLKPWVHEFQVHTAEGQLKCIRGHAIPEARQPNGSLVWNGLLLDVTEEKQTHRWLQQLSGAVEQSGDTVVITDCNGLIEYVNPSFEQLTGYTRAEVAGQTPRILKSGKHPPAFYETLWRTLLSGRSFRAEFINRKKSGALYHEDRVITPLKNATGQVTHFVATGRDVTARRLAEEALQQKLVELERFRMVTIDREHHMIELKEQINHLSQELGRPGPFDLSFLPNNSEGS
jgi:PAS domain S-box-containing protein